MVTHGKEEICTLFGRRGRISIFYTDKEGLAAKVVHVLVEHVTCLCLDNEQQPRPSCQYKPLVQSARHFQVSLV